jgi:hypothetical protein
MSTIGDRQMADAEVRSPPSLHGHYYVGMYTGFLDENLFLLKCRPRVQ